MKKRPNLNFSSIGEKEDFSMRDFSLGEVRGNDEGVDFRRNFSSDEERNFIEVEEWV
jgi:hypothetical protein